MMTYLVIKLDTCSDDDGNTVVYTQLRANIEGEHDARQFANESDIIIDMYRKNIIQDASIVIKGN
jgi:hypothetical protein